MTRQDQKLRPAISLGSLSFLHFLARNADRSAPFYLCAAYRRCECSPSCDSPEFAAAKLPDISKAFDEVLNRRIGSPVTYDAYIQIFVTMDAKRALKTFDNPAGLVSEGTATDQG